MQGLEALATETFSCPETPMGGGGGLPPLWLCGLGRPPSFWALCPHRGGGLGGGRGRAELGAVVSPGHPELVK